VMRVALVVLVAEALRRQEKAGEARFWQEKASEVTEKLTEFKEYEEEKWLENEQRQAALEMEVVALRKENDALKHSLEETSLTEELSEDEEDDTVDDSPATPASVRSPRRHVLQRGPMAVVESAQAAGRAEAAEKSAAGAAGADARAGKAAGASGAAGAAAQAQAKVKQEPAVEDTTTTTGMPIEHTRTETVAVALQAVQGVVWALLAIGIMVAMFLLRRSIVLRVTGKDPGPSKLRWTDICCACCPGFIGQEFGVKPFCIALQPMKLSGLQSFANTNVWLKVECDGERQNTTFKSVKPDGTVVFQDYIEFYIMKQSGEVAVTVMSDGAVFRGEIGRVHVPAPDVVSIAKAYGKTTPIPLMSTDPGAPQLSATITIACEVVHQ